MTTGRLQCVVNVAAGKETTVPFETPAPADVLKKVLVVGGGPAGLEAARTAALRGHEVHLYEPRASSAARCGSPRRRRIAPTSEPSPAGWPTRSSGWASTSTSARPSTPTSSARPTRRGDRRHRLDAAPRRVPAVDPVDPRARAELPHVFTSWDVLGFGGRATVGDGRRVRRHRDVRGDLRRRRARGGGGGGDRHQPLWSIGANVPYPPATVEAAGSG